MITASKSALAAALKARKGIVERRNTIPILANVGFERGPAGLQLRMTDLDIEGTIDCPADLDMEFQPFTVPAEMLGQIVDKLPDGQIKIKLDAGKTQAQISVGRSRFELQVLPIGDLPTMVSFADGAAPTKCTTGVKDLLAAIGSVAFAISTEETRYYLNGIYIHSGADGALLVATDGHRLAKRWLRIDGEAPPGVIMPRKTVAALIPILNDLPKDAQVTIEANDSKIALTMPGIKITSKLIDGTFPNYRAVIPAPGAPMAEFEGKILKPAIERVTTIVSERGRAVKCAFSDGQLMLTVNNPDAGSAEETIAVEGNLQIEAGFNGKYVLEALKMLSDGPLTLAMQEAGSPAILRTDGDHEENLIVLMPMRV
ncbi:DNA polymerase III subunit beta [Allorhizobium taibaishanense]|uniref:Beta sliding clamp n=1 Tax=Allorhizobium taibaishanense TaxID=887144 RepID=A0A1Q9A2S4_9HYPH|nr:DNA polymerase III subunit beta [Allorhizobium taibaishanense]MBB4005844.1 DNA polymerase-3 subunit beta [Allorhizobium taibaishanense]OLP48890.1 DNA polymerase III subunit beta [Allorhizobium taibaishanense]